MASRGVSPGGRISSPAADIATRSAGAPGAATANASASPSTRNAQARCGCGIGPSRAPSSRISSSRAAPSDRKASRARPVATGRRSSRKRRPAISASASPAGEAPEGCGFQHQRRQPEANRAHALPGRGQVAQRCRMKPELAARLARRRGGIPAEIQHRHRPQPARCDGQAMAVEEDRDRRQRFRIDQRDMRLTPARPFRQGDAQD
jgi:hypothetical protein